MRGKLTFFIKKEVEADSIADAIAREAEFPITEIYKSDEKQALTNAVGFIIDRPADID